MSVDVLLCVPSAGNRNQEGWRLLVKELIAKITKLRSPLLCFDLFLGFEKIFGLLVPSWQTSLLCIVRDLAGDGLWLWLLALVTGDM